MKSFKAEVWSVSPLSHQHSVKCSISCKLYVSHVTGQNSLTPSENNIIGHQETIAKFLFQLALRNHFLSMTVIVHSLQEEEKGPWEQ